jgi:hypothetical protein
MTGRIIKGAEVVDRPGTLARVERMEQFGIRPDTARAVQSDRLAAVHEELGGQASEAGRIIRAGDERIRGDVRRAMTEGRGGLPVFDESTQPSGEALVGAARGQKETMLSARREQSRRLYAKAFKEAEGQEIDVAPTIKMLEEKMTAATTEKHKKVLREFYDAILPPKIAAGKGGKRMMDRPGPITEISKLDALQKRLRIKAKQLGVEGATQDKEMAGELAEVRNTLLDAIGQVSPAYRAATQAYKYRSRAIEKFEGEFKQSLLNKLTKVEKDYVHTAPAMLFGEQSSPELIRATKSSVLGMTEGERKWSAIKRGAMTDVIQNLDKTLALAPDKLAKLQAALSPKEFEAVKAFSQVLKDIGYVPWAQRRGAGEGRRVMQEEVGGITSKLLRRLTPSPFIQSRELERIAISKRAPEIAKELASGAGIRNALKLRQLSPQSREYAVIAAQLLGSNILRRATAQLGEE